MEHEWRRPRFKDPWTAWSRKKQEWIRGSTKRDRQYYYWSFVVAECTFSIHENERTRLAVPARH